MSVKLYKHNESGEVVACNLEDGKYSHVYMWEGCGATPKQIATDRFLSLYTPLPEAPEVGSTAWAIMMMEKGYKVTRKSFSKKNFWHLNKRGAIANVEGRDCSIRRCHNDWQLYAPPKPIVECLPHELPIDCLGRNDVTKPWVRVENQQSLWNTLENRPYWRHYVKSKPIKEPYSCTYCLPYAENAHLEGTVTDGEHGAVPKGYVPPHVPKLGDADYWQVGDETFCLVNGDGYVHDEDTGINFKKPYTMCISLCGEMAHTWYDKYGKEDVQNYRTLFHRKAVKKLSDGKFEIDFNYSPTRPHRIETCTTCDGTDDVESCAYCKDRY